MARTVATQALLRAKTDAPIVKRKTKAPTLKAKTGRIKSAKQADTLVQPKQVTRSLRNRTIELAPVTKPARQTRSNYRIPEVAKPPVIEEPVQEEVLQAPKTVNYGKTKEEDKHIFKTVASEVLKPMKRKYEVKKIMSSFPDDIWSADLVQYTTFAPQNDGFSYILCIVDCFTRFAWALPVKTKDADSVLSAFKDIVKSNNGRAPKYLWVDQGKEFYNSKVKEWLLSVGTKIYSTWGLHKSAIVERFNRTLKQELFKQFLENNTRRWVDILAPTIDEYNHRVHSTIKTTPSHAHSLKKPDDVLSLWNSQFRKMRTENETPPKFAVGDYVRITRKKNVFEKGYENNWSYEIFVVWRINQTYPWTYNIKDLKDEKIDGAFYEPDLQKTIQTRESPFLQTKTGETRVRKDGRIEEEIAYVGYPKKFNYWVLVRK